MIRLGSVSRRLLRTLVSTVIVVPPDYEVEDEDGPVVLLTEAEEEGSSGGALQFAHALAQTLDRELVLAHVVSLPVGWGGSYLSEEALTGLRVERRVGGERKLERWASNRGLGGYRAVVLEGEVTEAARSFLKKIRASAVVCGSRQLSPLARIFSPSVGMELSAVATMPVAIVPPEVRASGSKS